ncbi:peptidoglycan-binding protein [Sporolactobacillus terrae]|uniref:peptidoglycan-binding protein n=1 Tax=Sporolactobacillus terrae TaxID=269673 RepID=UPI001268E518|nr:peptidoglycan-binding protein [Sporolactobacillus terrae]
MGVQAIDTATKLNKEKAKQLHASGIRLVGRYIGSPDSWKTLEKAEVSALKEAGITIYSIRQTTNNTTSFFNYARGVSEAQEAEKWAESIGQPSGTAIYFAVDFDARGAALEAVKQFFKGVSDMLNDYKIGVYGSYSVVGALSETSYTDFYFQTYAWSNGKVSKHADLYQYKNGQTIADVTVDYNEVKGDVGEWGVTAIKNSVKPKAQSSGLIRKGDRGAAVKQLQKDLIKAGYSCGKAGADGIFGEATETAVKKLQRAYKISVDGIVGKYTLAALKKKPAKAKKTGSAVVPYPGHLIRNGSTGKDVERIQRALGINADGIFGKQTEAAVSAYQKRHDLSVDGIVGAQTWNTLF